MNTSEKNPPHFCISLFTSYSNFSPVLSFRKQCCSSICMLLITLDANPVLPPPLPNFYLLPESWHVIQSDTAGRHYVGIMRALLLARMVEGEVRFFFPKVVLGFGFLLCYKSIYQCINQCTCLSAGSKHLPFKRPINSLKVAHRSLKSVNM